jgi:hypothetical protein
MRSEIKVLFDKLQNEIDELKRKNNELEEKANNNNKQSYYDFFFSPKKIEKTPETILRTSSDSDLLKNQPMTPLIPRNIHLSEERLSSNSSKLSILENKHSSIDFDESIEFDPNTIPEKADSSDKLLDRNIAMAKIITKAT